MSYSTPQNLKLKRWEYAVRLLVSLLRKERVTGERRFIMIEGWMVSFFGPNLSNLVAIIFFIPAIATVIFYSLTRMAKFMDRNNK